MAEAGRAASRSVASAGEVWAGGRFVITDRWGDTRSYATADAVFPLLNNFARIPACGLIAQYNARAPFPGPDRLPVVMGQVLAKSLTIRGFIQREFADQRPAFYDEMGQWVRDGRGGVA